MLRTTEGQISDEQRLSKLKGPTERRRPKLVHNSNLGIKKNMAKRSELRREMDFHLKMLPISTESIQDGNRRKLRSDFSGQNWQRNQ